MAVYALIKPINSVETIDNIIIASPEVAENYLVANEGDYDYVIDLTEIDPTPGIGWTYDPGEDEFTEPPVDYEAQLEDALAFVAMAIENAALAYLAAGSVQRSIAVGNVLSNLSMSAPTEEIDLMAEVVIFLDLQAGG